MASLLAAQVRCDMHGPLAAVLFVVMPLEAAAAASLPLLHMPLPLPHCMTRLPGPYNAKFSNLCPAAVHAGVISNKGGLVLAHLQPGLPSYKGAGATTGRKAAPAIAGHGLLMRTWGRVPQAQH